MLKTMTTYNKESVKNIDTEDDNIEVLSNNSSYSIAMYLDKSVDPKYYARFIKSTEKMVRSNVDYKEYLEYLRDVEELNSCVFLKNVNSSMAEIQLHHYPFTLYDICDVICNYLVANDKLVSTFILADYVIGLHMNNLIGLVPLSSTIHELVHIEKSIKIPKKSIYGDYKLFYDTYKEYLESYKPLIEFLELNDVIGTDQIKYLELYKNNNSDLIDDIEEDLC
jgi:hypothetical protein